LVTAAFLSQMTALSERYLGIRETGTFFMPDGRGTSAQPEGVPHIVKQVTTHLGLIAALQDAVKGEKPIPFGYVELYPGKGGELEKLLEIVERWPTKLVEERMKTIRSTMPQGENVFVRWVGAQLLKLDPIRKLVRGKPHKDPAQRVPGLTKPQFHKLLTTFCEDLHAELRTPTAWVEPAPPGEVLLEKTLEDALTIMGLCDEPGNVVTQLTNTLALCLYGLRTSTEIPTNIYKPNHDLTIPKSLLDILNTLKYKESEYVFYSWLDTKISTSKENAQAATVFLKAIIGTTIGQDVESLTDLWKPPTAIKGREAEILFQPFIALRNSIAKLQISLRKQAWAQDLELELKLVERQLKQRYGEVFSYAYRTSLVTADKKSLVPRPEDFAQFAALSIHEAENAGLSDREIAKALVKAAESARIDNIGPLTNLIITYFPHLVRDIGREAMRAGLIPFPHAARYAAEKLRINPWKDIADVDLSKVVKPGVRIFRIYFFPGSFAPWTKGHEDLVWCGNAHLKSLPQTTSDGKPIQRAIIILPIVRTQNVEGYEKSTAHVGPIRIRTGSILLGSGYEFDRSEVMMTTALQPDPTKTDMSQRMVITANNIQAQLWNDLNKAGRDPDVELECYQLMGPEECVWENGGRDLAPRERQPERVTRPGAILVSRPGSTHTTIRNFQAISRHTGIETVIITAGTYSGSSAVRKELAEGTKPHALKETSLPYAIQHWGKEAVGGRERGLSTDEIIPSVTHINNEVLREYAPR